MKEGDSPIDTKLEFRRKLDSRTFLVRSPCRKLDTGVKEMGTDVVGTRFLFTMTDTYLS